MLRLREFWKLASIGLVLVALALLVGVTQAETEAKSSFVPTDLVPLTGVVQVSASSDHTCVLTTSGGVKCWGSRLLTPIDVPGLNTGVTTITMGGINLCALTTQGGVKCWGLYDNTVAEDVGGLSSGVAAISSGGVHTCALTTQGGVKCWGQNSDGQLGTGNKVDSLVPVDVRGLSSGVAAISSGRHYTCALTTQGGIKCWGKNSDGQLGTGNKVDSLVPVDVSGLNSGVAVISSGVYHTCALTTSSGVKCWGKNSDGQLGTGNKVESLVPVDMSGLSSGVAAIEIGVAYTCALTTQGGVKCWGWNTNGFLGTGDTRQTLTPVDVIGLNSDVTNIAVGDSHTCVLTTQGGVKCWGWNGDGQLGTGDTEQTLAPVDVSGLSSGVVQVSASSDHTCALTTSGGVKCWGYNGQGQLGTGDTIQSLTPVEVSGLSSGVTSIAVGANHTCALTTQGAVKCWGYNYYGQLGTGDNVESRVPVDVIGLSSGVAAISSGSVHTCALTTQGAVKCWGSNSHGQLGTGDSWRSLTPVDVSGLSSGVAAISSGSVHTCALTTQGAVKCWGSNSHGQLGTGNTIQSLIPVEVSGLSSGVTSIAVGASHTCALTTQGGVKCWGYNHYGQLGTGDNTQSLTPADVSGLNSGVTNIDGGDSHTCALTTQGGVKCWGYNHYGQLGTGDTRQSLTPVEVSGLSSGVTAIAAANEYTCALTTQGAVKCWGYNLFGAIGNGNAQSIMFPVDVMFDNVDPTPEPSPTYTPSLTPTPTPPGDVEGIMTVHSGFDPEVHGYNFDNFNAQGNWETFVETFGAENTISLRAKQWFKDVYETQWSCSVWRKDCRAGYGEGGACAGMTSTSSLIYANRMSIPQEWAVNQLYHAPAPEKTIAIPGVGTSFWNHTPVSDLIMVFQGRQATLEAQCEDFLHNDRSLTETVEILKESIESQLQVMPQLLSIKGGDGNGDCQSHSVLPIAWTGDDQQVTFTVYDPSHKDIQYEVIKVDLASQSWEVDMSATGNWGIWKSGETCEEGGKDFPNSLTAFSAQVLLDARTPIFNYAEYYPEEGSPQFDCRHLKEKGQVMIAKHYGDITIDGEVEQFPYFGQNASDLGFYHYTYDLNQPITVTTVYSNGYGLVDFIDADRILAVESQSEAGVVNTLRSDLSQGNLSLSAGGAVSNSISLVLDKLSIELAGLTMDGGNVLQAQFGVGDVTLTTNFDLGEYPLQLLSVGITTTVEYTLTMPSLEAGSTHLLTPSHTEQAVMVQVDIGSDGIIDDAVVVKPIVPVPTLHQLFLPLINR